MACTKERIQTIFFAMGTVCSITVYSAEHKPAVSAAKERVLSLHGKWNAYDSQSEVSHINCNAGMPSAHSLLLRSLRNQHSRTPPLMQLSL